MTNIDSMSPNIEPSQYALTLWSSGQYYFPVKLIHGKGFLFSRSIYLLNYDFELLTEYKIMNFQDT